MTLENLYFNFPDNNNSLYIICGSFNFKRWSFTLQKATFQSAKAYLSEGKRLPFAERRFVDENCKESIVIK